MSDKVKSIELARKLKNAKAARLQIEAYEELKGKVAREAKLTRDSWYVVGDALAELRDFADGNNQEYKRLRVEGEIDWMNKDERQGAIWLYENWQDVHKAFAKVPPAISAGLDSPQRIRQAMGELEGWRAPRKPDLHSVPKPAPGIDSAPKYRGDPDEIAARYEAKLQQAEAASYDAVKARQVAGIDEEGAYRFLGVYMADGHITMSREAIEVLYRYYAGKYHPDKTNDDGEKMALLNRVKLFLLG